MMTLDSGLLFWDTLYTDIHWHAIRNNGYRCTTVITWHTEGTMATFL